MGKRIHADPGDPWAVSMFGVRHILSRALESLGIMKPDSFADIVRLWTCRMIFRGGGWERLVKIGRIADPDVLELLNLDRGIAHGILKTKQWEKVRGHLHEMWVQLEEDGPVFSHRVNDNFRRFGRLIQAGQAEREVLKFLCMVEVEPVLKDVLDCYRHMSRDEVIRLLASALNLSRTQVKAVTAPDAGLAQAMLITWAARSGGTRLGLNSDRVGMAGQLLHEVFTPEGILRNVLTLAPAPTLALSDYPHLKDVLVDVRKHLRRVLRARKAGCNLLLYGRPGSGKSQLARVLGRSLRCPIYNVSDEAADERALGGEQRIEAARWANAIMKGRRAMLVFDEAEDVFRPDGMFKASVADRRKAWINRLLETNALATIWLSNSVGCFDDAFLRRFDFVCEMPDPPKKQRERIARRICRTSPEMMQRIVACTSLTPAIIARAADVTCGIHGRSDGPASEATMGRLLTSTLRAQGQDARLLSSRQAAHFEPTYLNPDIPLDHLESLVLKAHDCRICVHGPPGTGKSSLARWIADRRGQELQTCLASDVLSAFVGETERKLAKAFATARQNNAVLMLDEIDSLLRNRSDAVRSWEVTQVNELLSQLERFEGVLVASTNHFGSLDEAAKRRFDLKVRLGFMSAASVVRMLKDECRRLGIGEVSGGLAATAGRLANATPGDFAVATRQHVFTEFKTAEAYFQSVARECSLKAEGNRGAIGFACNHA